MVSPVRRLKRLIWLGGSGGYILGADELGRDVFSRLKTDGIVFDAEVIFLTRRLDYDYAIVPVMWHDIHGSRMRVRPRLALSVLWDLFRIPLIHRNVPRA